ncbi:MAG: ankyrin repeat domain-containing protein, partial [Terriglobia bacterium]
YWSPLPLIRTLLTLGAKPNYDDHLGFPCLIAALSTSRPDKLELLKLLIHSGADIEQRGHNDYTPLHWAAIHADAETVELLLAHGADPNARTRIDYCETPLEAAEQAGNREIVELLRKRIAER